MRNVITVLVLVLLSSLSARAFSLNSDFYRIYPEFDGFFKKKFHGNIERITKHPSLRWRESIVLVKDLQTQQVAEMYFLKGDAIKLYARNFNFQPNVSRVEFQQSLFNTANQFAQSTDIKNLNTYEHNRVHVFNSLSQMLNTTGQMAWIPLETDSYEKDLLNDLDYASRNITNSTAGISEIVTDAIKEKDARWVHSNVASELNSINESQQFLNDYDRNRNNPQLIRPYYEGLLLSKAQSKAYYAFMHKSNLNRFKRLADEFLL